MADRISSPADLKALAAKARGDLGPREGRKETQVTVHMGTCGIAAGARDIVGAFMAAMAAAGVRDVSLHQTGCAGLCEWEPMATVTAADGTLHRYGLLDRDKVQAIVDRHLAAGAPVDEYLITT
jgi:(2Fe-2S) ferredoxin